PDPGLVFNAAMGAAARRRRKMAEKGLGWLRYGRGRERLLHDAQHLLARALDDRLEASELESSELDSALHAHGQEAEVGEEAAREDRLVDVEALVVRLALRIPVREGLERLRALVLRVADRSQEERLHHPRARGIDQIRTR